jgi:ATP synthase in type III secretion protein N
MEEVILEKLKSIKPITYKGRLTYAVGTVLKAKGLEARIGQQCTITDKGSNNCVKAEVVGITESEVVLMPLGDIRGIAQDSEISVVSEQPTILFGEELQGKVLDALGNFDGLGGNGGYLVEKRVFREPVDPIRRIPISEPFHTGIKAIDGLLTTGV